KRLASKGVEAIVESGAGITASISDADYEAAGAKIGDPWSADLIAKVAPPSSGELGKLSADKTIVGYLQPLTNVDVIKGLAASGATALAMEAVPRTSRAQSMDALSSQANIAGYRAVLIGAQEMPRFFPMLTTAAGTVKPATVLVLGVGVAGLQAIATAKRLGAKVTGYDVRSAVAEQVRSLGATFLELEAGKGADGEGGYARELTDDEKAAQQKELVEKIGTFDVVITTALVPGRKAPILVSAAAVAGMKPGSVIVDLAGEAGGNVEGTKPGETYKTENGVTIAAPLNLPSTLSEHASQLYARNVFALIEILLDDEGNLKIDFEDDIVDGATIVAGGEIRNERSRELVASPTPAGGQ
ncbi:MAG: NAD(P) transhydrogenase subunit alpha, partial [Solirubrobacteraceae bacterium]|nr:NAD(P) transhydrogenase subunit alpha [Solirubrobacteraceae bacterium]